MNSKHIDLKYIRLSGILLAFLLSACAPSGGSSDDANDSSALDDNAGEVTQQNLEIDRDFDLRATQDLQLTVTNTNTSAGEGYLSVCRAKQDQGNSVIDYENCLLRTRLTEEVYMTSLKLPAHYDKLFAALWFYDVSISPSIWEISEAELKSGAAYLAL